MVTGRRVAALLGIVLASALLVFPGAVAGVASYWHARAVAAVHAGAQVVGAPDMSPWLPFTTDGMLLAAGLVIYFRRVTGARSSTFAYVAAVLALGATLAANLENAGPGPWGAAVAVWAPLTFAIADLLLARLVGPIVAALRGVEAQHVAQQHPPRFGRLRRSWAVVTGFRAPPVERPLRETDDATEIDDAARSHDVLSENPREGQAGPTVGVEPPDDDVGLWTEDDERIRRTVQAAIDDGELPGVPSGYYVRTTHSLGRDRADRIVARLRPAAERIPA